MTSLTTAAGSGCRTFTGFRNACTGERFNAGSARNLPRRCSRASKRTIEENTDKVHVLALCDACGVRVAHYGIAHEAADPEYLIL
jgi:hypothetical protein